MAESKYFFLTDKKRFLTYPFRLKEVGWLPGHFYSHKNRLMEDFWISFGSNYIESTCTEKNGEMIFDDKTGEKGIVFSVTLPGTRLNTIKASVHDELYFRFDKSCAPFLFDLIGEHRKFLFSNWPAELMIKLQNYLHKLDTPGVADRVDQLAVEIVSSVILQHIEEQKNGNDSVEMRLFSAADGLLSGKTLSQVARENGFSLRSFYREWKKQFDVSPKEFVISNRIRKAVELLKQTDAPTDEIARQCGFNDVKQLHLWFNKKIGTSPGRYRRQFANGKAELFRQDGTKQEFIGR